MQGGGSLVHAPILRVHPDSPRTRSRSNTERMGAGSGLSWMWENRSGS
ncbi:hypothetical protein NSERUTF1_5885 [Nocardia seriolae]|nr:hypothetical protein NSERUTF1_5885 [Nocardia seriolae]